MHHNDGELLDWTPARIPGRYALSGSLVRLESVDPERHAAPLFEASHGSDGDPHLWDYMSYGPFADQEAFRRWMEERAESDDPLFFVVVDVMSGLPAGMASYLNIMPEAGVIETGSIWFAAMLQRTRQATEAIYLLMHHAFDDLGYRRLEWKCDARNARSRRAAERFGFTFEGIFRQHRIVKRRNRDTAWYSMLDHEWPAVQRGFEAWLSPANFEQDGKQRRSLSVIREAVSRGGVTEP